MSCCWNRIEKKENGDGIEWEESGEAIAAYIVGEPK